MEPVASCLLDALAETRHSAGIFEGWRPTPARRHAEHSAHRVEEVGQIHLAFLAALDHQSNLVLVGLNLVARPLRAAFLVQRRKGGLGFETILFVELPRDFLAACGRDLERTLVGALEREEHHVERPTGEVAGAEIGRLGEADFGRLSGQRTDPSVGQDVEPIRDQRVEQSAFADPCLPEEADGDLFAGRLRQQGDSIRLLVDGGEILCCVLLEERAGRLGVPLEQLRSVDRRMRHARTSFAVIAGGLRVAGHSTRARTYVCERRPSPS